jgi:hypothetical protein
LTTTIRDGSIERSTAIAAEDLNALGADARIHVATGLGQTVHKH